MGSKVGLSRQPSKWLQEVIRLCLVQSPDCSDGRVDRAPSPVTFRKLLPISRVAQFSCERLFRERFDRYIAAFCVSPYRDDRSARLKDATGRCQGFFGGVHHAVKHARRQANPNLIASIGRRHIQNCDKVTNCSLIAMLMEAAKATDAVLFVWLPVTSAAVRSVGMFGRPGTGNIVLAGFDLPLVPTFDAKRSDNRVFGLGMNAYVVVRGTGQYIYLEEWGDPRRETLFNIIKLVLAETEEPLTFEQVLERTATQIGHGPDKKRVTACLQAIGVFDRETELWILDISRDEV